MWKRNILKGRTPVYNILLDINMFIVKEHFFKKIKYYLSHYLFKELYRNHFIITPGKRWISLGLNLDYLKSFAHILSCQFMQLYLNENLWLEGGSVSTRVVVQLLQALSCLRFSVPFYPEIKNELLLGPRESISILHFIMWAIF